MANLLNTCLIALMLLPTGLLAQNKLDDSGNKHGAWTGTFESGKKRYTGQFNHGKPYGTFNYFTPAGSLESTLVFSEDASTSKATVYYPKEKKLMAVGNYIGQQRDSVWTFYSVYGYISSRETYKDGQKQGATIVYYDNGKVARQVTFENGVETGPTIEFFDTGKKKMEGSYENGRLEGRVTRYHPNGFIYAQGNYSDGRRHGNWIFYDERGKVQKRKRFYRGQDATKPEPKKKDGPSETGQ